MSPAVEVVIFPASDAYLKDPSLINRVFEIVNDWGGKAMYQGIQVEDGKTAYLFIVWESVQAHQALIAAPIYAELGAAIKLCLDGPLDMFHVHFEPTESLAAIFNAPVTSLALLTKLQEGKTEADFAKAMSPLNTLKADGIKGCHGGAWGKKVEKEEFAFLTAWDAVEDHVSARTEAPSIQQFLAGLRDTVADRQIAHVKLSSYKKYE